MHTPYVVHTQYIPNQPRCQGGVKSRMLTPLLAVARGEFWRALPCNARQKTPFSNPATSVRDNFRSVRRQNSLFLIGHNRCRSFPHQGRRFCRKWAVCPLFANPCCQSGDDLLGRQQEDDDQRQGRDNQSSKKRRPICLELTEETGHAHRQCPFVG